MRPWVIGTVEVFRTVEDTRRQDRHKHRCHKDVYSTSRYTGQFDVGAGAAISASTS